MKHYILLFILAVSGYLLSIACKPDTSTTPVPSSKVKVIFDEKALECVGSITPYEMKINVDGGDILNNPEPIDSKKFYGSNIVNNGLYEMTIPQGAHGITVKITYPAGTCNTCCTAKCNNQKGGEPVLRGTQVFQNGTNEESVTVSLQSCRNCCN